MIHLFEPRCPPGQPAEISGQTVQARPVGVCLYPNTGPLLLLETREGWRFADLPIEAFPTIIEGGGTPPRPEGALTWTADQEDVLVCTRTNDGTHKVRGWTLGFVAGEEDNVLWMLVVRYDDNALGWLPLSRLQFVAPGSLAARAPLPTWTKARGAAVVLLAVPGRCGSPTALAAVRRLEWWGLPGGKVEAGETPWAAACREVEEELGPACAAVVRRLGGTGLAPEAGVMVDTQYVGTTEVTCFILLADENEVQVDLEPRAGEYAADWITLDDLRAKPAFPEWLRRLLAPRNLVRLTRDLPRTARDRALRFLRGGEL